MLVFFHTILRNKFSQKQCTERQGKEFSRQSAVKFIPLFSAIIFACNFISPRLSAQTTDNIVRAKLRQIALGNASDVRAELPDLQRAHPNDAGIQFLSATLSSDGSKALPQFVRITRENPQSIWADDAQWRVVQIYSLRKDTANARSELQNFRRNYPTSEFLLFAAEIVKSTVGLPPTFTTYRNPIVVASNSRTATPAPATKTMTPTESPKTEIPKKEIAKPEVKPEPKSEIKTESKSEIKTEPKSEQKPQQASIPAFQVQNDSYAAEERYTLQVGIYSSRESAIVDVQKLLKARLRSDVIEKNTDGAARFAVTVGDYKSREAAEKAKAVVQKACACVPFVVVK